MIIIFIQLYSNSVVLNFITAFPIYGFYGIMSFVTNDPL
jgi:hypothetical protein